MRYPNLSIDDMSPRQREVANKITQCSGDEIKGPYAAMLYSPEMAERSYLLGHFLRRGLRIPERLRVMAVLLVIGRHKCDDVSAYIPLRSVQESLLDHAKIQSIAQGVRPQELTRDEEAVYTFCTELANNGRVKDATFDMLANELGKESALELVGVCGYVALLTNVINITQRMDLQDGTADIF